MVLKKVILIIMIFSCLSISVFAKANMKLIDRYLEISGTQEIILALPQQIEKGYLESIKDKKLKQIDIKSSFDPKQTMKYVKFQLSQNFSDRQLRDIIRYYKSPLGQKFKNSGLKAVREKDDKKKARFYKQLKKNPPSYDRLNIMSAFADRLEFTPIAMHLIGEFLGSINADLVYAGGGEDIAIRIKKHMLDLSLYAYKDFSKKELKNILAYYYTNAGRSEQAVISKIFKELVAESFSQILEENQHKSASVK